MVLYGILVALSAVIVGVYAVWNLTVRPPEIPQEPDPAPPAGSGSQAGEPVEQEQPAGRQRREDVYNFVLLGRDRESANTDTIIVVSYDVANQKVGMISIPRDTAVNRDWRKDPKINGAYAGAGVDVLKEEIEQTWKTMQGRPEFADIEELTNNQNERFLFSTQHLTRRYAKAISDVDDFCD